MVVVLYGTCALFEALLVCFIPETRGGEIPDTIEEARVAHSARNLSNRKKSNQISFVGNQINVFKNSL